MILVTLDPKLGEFRRYIRDAAGKMVKTHQGVHESAPCEFSAEVVNLLRTHPPEKTQIGWPEYPSGAFA